jgi:hypothetical protein
MKTTLWMNGYISLFSKMRAIRWAVKSIIDRNTFQRSTARLRQAITPE